ncbi:MAG: aldose 1-epimerase [Candidatus Thermoplasmatota archaeon]|nr:aldose 1-epimerase [Candidatus Thermoplasmatota archaeon]
MSVEIEGENGSKASVETRGGYVSNLNLIGTPILKPSSDGIATHGGAALLMPYANRIRGATYSFDGKSYRFAPNNGNDSIHGFVRDLEWNLVEIRSWVVSLEVQASNEGYPSSINCKEEIEIGESFAEFRLGILNTGEQPCPAVIGCHPYLLFDEFWRISSDSDIMKLEVENGYFPTGNFIEVESGLLSSQGGKQFDTCYVSQGKLSMESKSCIVTMERHGMPYFMLYNGSFAGSNSVAIEPMTGAPDAFNNGIGLSVLEPGAELKCSFALSLNLKSR